MRNSFNQKPKAHNNDEGWLLPTQLFVKNKVEIYSQPQAENIWGYGPQATTTWAMSSSDLLQIHEHNEKFSTTPQVYSRAT
jgi:hypothetical protein